MKGTSLRATHWLAIATCAAVFTASVSASLALAAGGSKVPDVPSAAGVSSAAGSPVGAGPVAQRPPTEPTHPATDARPAQGPESPPEQPGEVPLAVPDIVTGHIVIVTGLGGEPFFTDIFEQWASSMRDIALERLGIAQSNVHLLSSRGDDGERVTTRSLLATLDRIARTYSGSRADAVLLVLIGHGNAGRGGEGWFNVTGPDLSASALADALRAFGERPVGVVVAAPSSAAFARKLAASNRVILTATSGSAEIYHTEFGGFFVDAFADGDADADKNGRVSLLEAFQFAAREVKRAYEADRRLQTEHAQMEDNGDGEPTSAPAGDAERDPGAPEPDGAVAKTFYLRADAMLAGGTLAPDDPRLELTLEARRLLGRIERLKRDKNTYERAAYDARLESLLVALALNRRSLRATAAGATEPAAAGDR